MPQDSTVAYIYPPNVPGVPIQCAPCTYGVNVVSVQTCASECRTQKTKQGQNGCLYFWEDTRHAVNIIAISVASIITAFFVWWSNRYYSDWYLVMHICFCVTGTVLFSTMGILMFAGDHCFGKPYKRRLKACAHAYFMVLSYGLVLTGTIVYFIRPNGPFDKYMRGKANKKERFIDKFTIHGLVGYSGLGLMLLAIFFGFFAMFRRCCRCCRPAFCKCSHILFGLSAFVLCIACFCLELKGKWFKKNSTHNMWLAFIVMTATVVGYTCIAAFFSMMYYMMFI